MKSVGYRLDVLVRLAEMGRRRAVRSFAAAVADARQKSDRAEHLATVARTIRYAATSDATTSDRRSVDVQRRFDAHTRCQARQYARLEHERAQASDAAVLAHARVADTRRILERASRDARLQEALRDAVSSRMKLEQRRRDARQANSSALDAWCARMIPDDD